MKTPLQVYNWCKQQSISPTSNWTGLCLKFTRSAYGVSARYSSAAIAWKNATKKHATSSSANIPSGVPVFWLGGSQGYGHVAVSAGNGKCWTTDFAGAGKVSLTSIDAITRAWGQKFVGWSEDLNGVTVWKKPVAPTPTAPAPTPSMDKLIEQARYIRSKSQNDRKKAAMVKIIEIAKPWSTKY